ncbi:MAG TPA: NAD-binding protein [Candidatus Binatia bacterium]|nr:NAD-binding protein [Candidatus Binatia bacterium]
MSANPLILVVGGDTLTERVCAELTSTAGHDVRVVWPVSPDSDDALKAADVERATSILTLSSDDGLNLAIALRARMLNRKIRVVLRQFNPVLGTKIEQNLPDCTVLSPAAHSAATYAGAALDPGCFFALRFPAQDGPLLGFTQTTGAALGAAGSTVLETEERSRLRILALGERLDPPAGAAITGDDALVTFGRVVERAVPHHHRAAAAQETSRPARRRIGLKGLVAGWHRLNPVLRLLLVAAVVFFSFSFSFFHFVLHRTWTAASFYVVETMTNVGFGDTTVTKQGPIITGGAILAMLGGIIFTSIFIGYVSSALTRAQWIAMQGLRRIRARGHIVICGGGKIGSAVVNLLAAAGKRMVVIEPKPDASLVRRARERDVDLLTGDAHRDDALDLCDIPNAAAVLALTDNDAINLEIALAARARSPDVPLVVRMENDAFARAVSALFGIATFSPAALTAPVLAGLSRFPGTRGRVRYAGEDHTISQRSQSAVPEKPPADVCTPLCVWRGGQLLAIRDFTEMQPYDELLFVVPLGQFRPTVGFSESSPVLHA